MDPVTVETAIKAARVELEKQDIPEVESEIGFLLGLLGDGGLWTPEVEEVVRTELQAIEGEPTEDLILAILGAIYTVTQRAFLPPSAVQGAVQRLLTAGGALSVEELASHRGGSLAALARRDLTFWLNARAEARQEALRIAVGSAIGGDLEAGVAAVREALDAKPEIVADAIVDTWAYRTFVVGAVLAAEIRGQRVMVVDNNPPFGPDGRTTAFCRWAHGRPIATDRAVRMVDAYNAAMVAGDAEGAKKAWPLLDAKTARGKGVPFDQVVVGLPPFHRKCRSTTRMR